ncbi:ATP-dependent bile acid permease [Cytidiella melzeri]|nr:ATP-dependent bile acid permease [Cytidiella melzeri]
MNRLWRPKPVAPKFGEGQMLPQLDASLVSRLLFRWLDSLLRVGFTRPLEKEDLWQLPPAILTETISGPEHSVLNLAHNLPKHKFADVALDVEKYGEALEVASIPTQNANPGQSKEDSSLAAALYMTFRWQWWIAGLLKLASDTLKTTTPLLNQRLLTWLTASYMFYKAGPEAAATAGMNKPQGIGYGIGLAFALFALQEVASLMTNHFMQTTMTVGVAIRTGTVGAIFRKALRLSGRARLAHSVGQVTTMISTDATRLDHGCHLWVAPIQIAVGIGLLIGTLGYSALVGLGAILLGIPIQAVLIKIVYDQRQKMVAVTDQRIGFTTEVLQGIRLIKFYAWESFYSGKIAEMRGRELQNVKNSALALALMIAWVIMMPVVATVLSFITYSLSGHDLTVPTIFTSLQFFNILHQQLGYLPFAFAGAADAAVGLTRISTFLTAEELDEPNTIDEESEFAISVEGSFQWEATYNTAVEGKKATEDVAEHPYANKKNGKTEARDKVSILPTTMSQDSAKNKIKPQAEEDKPFELKNLKLEITKGSFVAVVGRVASGKILTSYVRQSSLLQALIGEMKKVNGTCVFSSPAAYVPQSSWIMNATLRDNIIFGRAEDEEKLQEVIRACCLEKDLEMLPNGEYTEIGEKGINLSGGQKARVSLARAAYSGVDIILMDDSLSAFDAHVGKAILEDCLLSGPLAGKTRVLVTHALHVLHRTDYIYVVDDGAVVEQGTYQELMRDSVLFSRVMEEYGTRAQGRQADHAGIPEANTEKIQDRVRDSSCEKGVLMQEEERITGAVSGTVYKKYFQYAVSNSLFLGFWTSQSIDGFTQVDYIAVYAALGAAVGLFSFACIYYICITGVNAGFNMFKASLSGVLHSSVAFFDTTPMGRVLSRLSKDQDTIDTEIALIAFVLLTLASSIIGTAALVFYTFPLLGIAFAPLTILYYLFAVFYRRTSVEVKRLDSLMRSALYGSYSETLTGLSTTRFIRTTDHGLDMENRAYFITIAIQRWLGVRLDVLGNLLILGIALFAAGSRKTVDPGKVGVVLSYTLSITQTLSELVSTYAQNEQNFNAVERVLHYTELPAEGSLTTPDDPPPSWPTKGDISFESVEMAYREGLPPVLKSVSFNVRAGEKIGIVGRTGAGKSSLLQALFRVVNLQAGSISIDGRDIAAIGLNTLRSRLALVPQDNTLFLGTLRDNLDPLASRTDAELIDALKKAGLISEDGTPAQAKFNLDAPVNDEGSNYSAGEKQLVALCRALIKNSKITVLDEATSSVDAETDAKLQRIIQTQFASSSTLLCIAHRLNTISFYDRVLVMDNGQVAEFDTPLRLFDNERSIFRSLCNEASLTRRDIVRIRYSLTGYESRS